jgi:cullin-associated NEDD8-dissociated protein 1
MQSHSQIDQQKLVDKLEECRHFDKDNRFMGALDLCAEMTKANFNVEEGMEKRIC